MENILVARGLKKYYGVGNTLTKALDGVDLEVKKGEFVAIVGASGSGKSTLLHMLGGLDNPTSGNVIIEGIEIGNLDRDELTVFRRRQIGFIFQNYNLVPVLNTYENIILPLELDGRIPDEGQIKRIMDILHLSEKEYSLPSQLSGGQQQRVSIARALINKPGVLLLDEPLSALDAKLRQNLLIELDTIHDEVGITFIFITHDQQEALSISDRIAVMNEGKVLQVGTPAEVYEAPADSFVADFIGENNFFDGRIVSIQNETYATLVNDDLGELIFEMDKPAKVGDYVQVSIRPEKIKLSKTKPKKINENHNILKVYVDEVIYSGFQSKYFVWLNNDKKNPFKVFKQHAVYFDDNDEGAIWWDEDAYISWDADDGFLVEVRAGEEK